MKPFLLLSCTLILMSAYTPPVVHPSDPGTEKNGKRKAIKLYPNPTYNGSITISSISQDVLVFYMFDLDGKMLHKTILNNNERQTINGLKKGSYLYTVLNNDENIDGGKIIVK